MIQRLLGVLSLAVIVAAGYSLWSNTRVSGVANGPLHREVGRRLADEVAAVVGSTGRLAIVSLERGASEVLDLQMEGFRERLSRWPGLSITRLDEVSAEKGGKYRPGDGLSARRFRRIREKESDVDLVVSFLGVPDPGAVPGKRDGKGAPLVAICRSPRELAPLIERGWVAGAIVPRFTFPAPGPEVPRTDREWFENRYQVVREDAAR